jgi:hypothetical protein
MAPEVTGGVGVYRARDNDVDVYLLLENPGTESPR